MVDFRENLSGYFFDKTYAIIILGNRQLPGTPQKLVSDPFFETVKIVRNDTCYAKMPPSVGLP